MMIIISQIIMKNSNIKRFARSWYLTEIQSDNHLFYFITLYNGIISVNMATFHNRYISQKVTLIYRLLMYGT